MREHWTNSGKKEQRQYKQLLDKVIKEGRTGEGSREVEGRTVPKQHSMKKRKNK